MSGTDISFGLAFFAGVASFISPCVLSLVPAYVGYLGSRAVTVGAPGAVVAEGRLGTLLHGVFFVLGFSLIFIVLGLGASAIGALAFDTLRTLVVIGEFRFGLIHIGGLIVIVFGLHTLGVIHIPWLEYDLRRKQPPDRSLGYLSSALIGVFFSAGWAPCVGPVLGAVLTMAMSSEGLARGGWLLAAYSAGLGIPFLLAAAGIGSVTDLLRRYRKYLRYVSVVTGAFLIMIGILLLTDQFSRLTVLFPGLVDMQIWIDENVVAIYERLAGGVR